MDLQLNSAKHSRNIPHLRSSASSTNGTSNNPGAALKRRRSGCHEHSNVHVKKPIERESDQKPMQGLEGDEDAMGKKVLDPPELKIGSHDHSPTEAGKPIEPKSDREPREGIDNHNANSEPQDDDGYGKKVLDSASQSSREPKIRSHEHTSLPEAEEAIGPESDQISLKAIDNQNSNSEPQDDDGPGAEVDLDSASQCSSKPKTGPHEHTGLPEAEKQIESEPNRAPSDASGIHNSNSNPQEDSGVGTGTAEVLDPAPESSTEPEILYTENGEPIIYLEDYMRVYYENIIKPEMAEQAKNDPYFEIRELVGDIFWDIHENIITHYGTDNLDFSDCRELLLNEKRELIGLGQSKPVELKLPLVNTFMIERVGPDWEGKALGMPQAEVLRQYWFESYKINEELLEAYHSWRTYSEVIEPGLRDLWGYAHRVEQDPTFPKLASASDESEKSKWRQLVVERVNSMPDFQKYIQTRSKEFAGEIVRIFRPIRKDYYQYEYMQNNALSKLTKTTIKAHERVVTMYSKAGTGEFIFKYFHHNDKCDSSEMEDIIIIDEPTGMTDAEMDEDGNLVLLTISPAVFKRFVDANEPVLLRKARVWTTSAASDASVKRQQERHNEWMNEQEKCTSHDLHKRMGLGEKKTILT